MITFNRVVEIKERDPGIWYVRIVLDKDGVEAESDFLKIKMRNLPQNSDISPLVIRYLQNRNNPPAEPSFVDGHIPENLPDLPSMSGLSSARIRALWSDFIEWIKNIFKIRRS